jgi:hypothetical protein
MIPVQRLSDAVRQAEYKKSERQIIRQAEDFMLWTLLRSWTIEQGEDAQVLKVDIARLHHDSLSVLPVGFDSDIDETVAVVSLPVQAIYRALAGLKPPVSERDIDGLRPFFNDPAVRRAVSPVQVENRRPVAKVTPAPVPERRPTLSARRDRG